MHAGIGVLDWESSGCEPVHNYSGLQFSNARGTICTGINSSVHNGTRTSNDVSGLVAKHMAGIAFTPISIDLAEYSSALAFRKSIPLTFTGLRDGADPVSVTFTIDGLLDGREGIKDFQTFAFPESFTNITELRGPETLFSCDNFVFDTVVPPPFPEEFSVKPNAFSSYETIHTRGVHDDHFIVGPDFAYHTGSRTGNRLYVLGENPSVESGISNAFLDTASREIFYRSGSSLFKKTPAGAEELVSLQEVTNAGITASSLGKPVPSGKDLLFLAYDFHGSDAYRLLRSSSTGISIIVAPDTKLPLPGGSTGNPFHFPDFLTASGDSFAFDTSVSSSRQIARVFAVFSDGQPIRLVLSEGDQINTGSSMATVEKFLSLRFTTDGKLEVFADTTQGDYLLRYGNDDITPYSVEQISGVVISPENIGTLRSGTIQPSVNGDRIMESVNNGNSSDNTLFREHEGSWHRIIGVGDMLGGEKIAYMKYLATPSGTPDRVIVDVRFASSGSISHNIILNLSEPAITPPRIGRPEIVSGHLFIPIDQLTYGKRYFLSTSTDMTAWTNDGPDIEIQPSQHLIMFPENLGSSLFFRVREKPTE